MLPHDNGRLDSGPHISSNAFANGRCQNLGNHITSVPTTRVLRPPGGGSSICLGGEDSSRIPERVSNGGKARVPPPRRQSESSFSIGGKSGSDSSKQSQLKSSRMQTEALLDDIPAAGMRTDELHQRKVETADRLGQIKQKAGSCSSATSDRRPGDAVRFHQENRHAVGRQQKPVVLRPEATKSVCESHRYYLAADGQADRLTGKAAVNHASSATSGGYPDEAAGKPTRHDFRDCTSFSGVDAKPKFSRSRSGMSTWDDDRYSQSHYSKSQPSKARGSATSQTTTTMRSRCSQSCYSASEADSIPFGADWSTFCK